MSVCVAVWKRHDRPNLTSIAEQLPAALEGLSGELVVVLNGLREETVELPRTAKTIPLPMNRGVPVAWNLAARAARGRIIVVLNDDVHLSPGSLARLHDALESTPGAGVAGPVGTRWDISRATHLHYVDMTGMPPGSSQECEVLSGFCLATPRSVFESTGGFDEAYTPCGFEEVDYCTAVRLTLGLKCIAVAGVDIRHSFAISAQRGWRRIGFDGRKESLGSIAKRNRQHFLRKWGTDPRAQP